MRNCDDLRGGADRRRRWFTTTSAVRRLVQVTRATNKAPSRLLRGTMTKVNADGSEVEPEDRDVIEKLLRRTEKNESIVLDTIECSPGSRLGDNYMSIVKRVRVKGTLNGSEGNFWEKEFCFIIYTSMCVWCEYSDILSHSICFRHSVFRAEFVRTMIIKRPILRLSRRRLFRCDEAFANEISAYRRLVPVLNRFVAHTGNALPFPRCLFAGSDAAGDLIVLEDLRESGFRMVDRLKGLDLAHCRLVMMVIDYAVSKYQLPN